MKGLRIVVFLTLVCFFQGCNDPTSTQKLTFDTASILQNWADNIIAPSRLSFASKAELLKSASAEFTANSNPQTLQALKTAFTEAYIDFQGVAIFHLGHAMDIKYFSYINTYPANAHIIGRNINAASYEFEKDSYRSYQGLPAIDYLLNGIKPSDAEVIQYFKDTPNARTYLNKLCERIVKLTDEVIKDWNDKYKAEFLKSTGTDANSSFNLVVNTYVRYYENYLRRGKVGIPLGNGVQNTYFPEKIEAFYDKTLPKLLLKTALQCAKDFFNGKSMTNAQESHSLKQTLDYLKSQTRNTNQSLSQAINNQFDEAIAAVETTLNDNFSEQIKSDPNTVWDVYFKIQSNVTLMKVDMAQALSINITYLDADGD